MIMTRVLGSGVRGAGREAAAAAGEHQSKVPATRSASALQDSALTHRKSFPSIARTASHRSPTAHSTAADASLVGQQREGDGFFRFGGHSEFVGEVAELSPSGASSLRSMAMQRGILRAAAGDDQFADSCRWVGRTNRWTASAMERAVSAVAVATTSVSRRVRSSCEEIPRELAAKLFAAGGLRWLLPEEGCRSRTCATTLSSTAPEAATRPSRS